MKKGGNYFLLIKYVKLNLFNIFMAFQNQAHLGNIYFDFLLLTNFPSDPNSYTQLFSDTVPFKLIHFSSVPSPEPNNWFDDKSDILVSDNRTFQACSNVQIVTHLFTLQGVFDGYTWDVNEII